MTYTLDCRDAERLSAFWAEALGYSSHGARGSYWPLVPPASLEEPWFVLQEVAEPKSGKNRMHIDIHVTDLEAEAKRLEALGARRISEDAVVQSTYSWLVMADPEGNEFCLVHPGE